MYLRVASKLRSVYQKIRLRLADRKWRNTSPLSTVIACRYGQSADKKHNKLCLFSTFDPKGRIDPYVKEYLREISSNGFDIVLISTSPEVVEKDINELSVYCRAVIHRENVGLDFGSWKAAMQQIPDWNQYDRLLLANDSVYGPFFDLGDVFRRCEAANESVVGLTDNFEASYHLQSYFLYFKEDTLKSDLFQSFWDGVRLSLDKNFIINAYEVGLSQVFLHHDIALKALYPFYDVREYALALGKDFKYWEMLRSQPVNSSLYMWDLLIEKCQFPFLKTEIVKVNRLNFPNVVNWRTLIPEERAQWRSLIENHLKRVVPNARG